MITTVCNVHVTDDGIEVAVDGLQGFAEEARQHW